jgi:hypothetical protein
MAQAAWAMQFGASLCAALVFLGACSERIDYVTGQPPFINKRCSYEDFASVEASARSAAQSHGLKVKTRADSAGEGVFMILMWRKDINISLGGVPDSKDLFFTAVKRAGPSADDWAMAKSVAKSLQISCA